MATVTTHTLYAFAELSPDAQETAIEQWRDYTAAWFDSGDIEHVTDSDYWAEKALEIGLTVAIVRGKQYEHDVSWSTNPDGLMFGVDRVDLAVFMRSQKIAGKYRTLYSASNAHNAWASISERDGAIVQEDCDYCGDDNACCERLETQANAVQDILQSAYDDLCSAWMEAINAELEYLSTDEYIREQLEDCYTDQDIFTESGKIARH